MKNFLNFYKEATPEFKKNSLIIFLTYFFVLFSYPLVRSASSAFFYEVYTAKEYSFATFIGIAALMLMIFINNFIQNKIGVQKLYVFTGLLTIVVFFFSYLGFKAGIKEFAIVLFATKEAYIVLLIHTCLAFSNAYYKLDELKMMIGPIGAMGSLGGIIGGQLTSFLAKEFGTETVFYTSLVIILFTVFSFYLSKNVIIQGLEKSDEKLTPIRAIKGVRKYVFLIAAIVGLSQFVLYIAEFQFNIVFEQVVTLKDERTAYLGRFYSYVNIVSILLQFFVLPYLLLKVKTRTIFFAIPILYLMVILGGLSFGASSLFVVGAVFVTFKGTDYSVFAVAKEVMYNPLMNLQKFGAKYITDMFVYRLSKALIAFLFALEFFKINFMSMKILSSMQFIFLTIWVILVFILFKEQEKLNK